MMRMPETQAVLSKLEQIETEMWRVDLWQEEASQLIEYLSKFDALF